MGQRPRPSAPSRPRRTSSAPPVTSSRRATASPSRTAFDVLAQNGTWPRPRCGASPARRAGARHLRPRRRRRRARPPQDGPRGRAPHAPRHGRDRWQRQGLSRRRRGLTRSCAGSSRVSNGTMDKACSTPWRERAAARCRRRAADVDGATVAPPQRTPSMYLGGARGVRSGGSSPWAFGARRASMELDRAAKDHRTIGLLGPG